MSNRNLTHYFSPNSVQAILSAESVANGQECTTPVNEKASKKNKQRAAKEVTSEDDDDFENEPILTPQHGNAITKYFSPVDKSALAVKKKKHQKPPIMTVEAQVHGSPSKQNAHIILKFKKVTKKAKKKKLGIPESHANKIELVSSEEIEPVALAPVQPEVPSVLRVLPKISKSEEVEPAAPASIQLEVPATLAPVQPEVSALPVVIPKENPIRKQKWQLRLRLDDSVNSSDGDFEDNQEEKDGPRRSVRLRSKPPPPTPNEPIPEEAPKKLPKKKRKKEENLGDDEDDIEILSEDVAPIFLKKKLQEEARAVKKAKQDFLFSGVPEVLKQATTAQQKLEQRPIEIFPKISHVTQAGSRPWHLPFPEKHLIPLIQDRKPDPVKPRKFSLCLCLSPDSLTPSSQAQAPPQIPTFEWRDCKQIICKMKEELSLSFPFFRTLRNLLPKSSRDNYESMLWTDAYAPKSSLDFLTTHRKPANQLKTWLNQWKLRGGEEAPATPKKPGRKPGKRKRIDSGSGNLDDDDVVIDEKSNSSWSCEERLSTCMLLVGPSGCGKTATVYALAEELGFNVLEVNASSKRNGKTVLSQLHEATQSHSLTSTTPTANTLKNFFSGAKSAPKPPPPKSEEKRPAMSLALFKDVDIVFETEDESFYGALTTLIQTSKRPIIMTLGTTHERALTLVQDKIKSFFDVILFTSPDISTACGYLWSLSLAKGYPLNWASLHHWIAVQTQIDIDLRSLIIGLQFLLQHHPLGLKLNFTQLQLKGEEESPISDEAKLPSNHVKKSANDVSQAGSVVFIDLPTCETVDELPMPVSEKSFKFECTDDSIDVVAKKGKYCRILDPDAQDDTDEETEEKQQEQSAKWNGDLVQLAQLLEFRANKDFIANVRGPDDFSWNERSLLTDIEEFSRRKCIKLLEKEFEGVLFENHEARATRLQNDESLQSANSILLNSSVTRVQILQRKAGNSDILPYLRSFLRSDLTRNVGKRRRKGTKNQSASSVRLPSLDLVLSTSTVLELANQF